MANGVTRLAAAAAQKAKTGIAGFKKSYEATAKKKIVSKK